MGSDAGVFHREIGLQSLDHGSQAAGVPDQIVVFVDLQRRESGRAAERMAVVGQAALEHLLAEVIGNRLA